MNRRCLFIFMSIGIRRKESEISGICLFLVTHLNHELTRAAYELRVWVRARAQLKTLSSLLNLRGRAECEVIDNVELVRIILYPASPSRKLFY